MSGKKRLRNIANGLCGAFASRNNDLGGYWAIGKLRSLAGQFNRTTVIIDLLTSSMQPSSCEFTPLLARYQRLVAELANLTHVPLEDLTVARITLDFMPAPWPRASYCKPHWGDQFTLTVTVDAHGRAAGIERHAGYCRPHDPAPVEPISESDGRAREMPAATTAGRHAVFALRQPFSARQASAAVPNRMRGSIPSTRKESS